MQRPGSIRPMGRDSPLAGNAIGRVCEGAPDVGDQSGDHCRLRGEKNKKFISDFKARRGGRVAEGGGLLRRSHVEKAAAEFASVFKLMIGFVWCVAAMVAILFAIPST
jgi:hypothetical protein